MGEWLWWGLGRKRKKGWIVRSDDGVGVVGWRGGGIVVSAPVAVRLDRGGAGVVVDTLKKAVKKMGVWFGEVKAERGGLWGGGEREKQKGKRKAEMEGGGEGGCGEGWMLVGERGGGQ